MFVVSEEEAIRYSCGGDRKAVAKCSEMLYSLAAPRTVYRVMDILDVKPLLVGKDITRHLGICKSVILMAATLGHEVDRKISALQLTSPDMALVLHGCAAAAIESVCDELEFDLRQKFDGKYLTDRFSIGYGDLPLSVQAPFCRTLDAERRIGITVDENGWMHPSKSVTAFIGVSDVPVTGRGFCCARCDNFYTCHGKKKGACRMEE